MSSSPLTLTAADAAGTQYEVFVSPLGTDTATLSVSEWAPGVDTLETDPLTDNVYDLSGIKVAGDVITCETTAVFGTPEITITLGDTGVTIAVSHILFAPGPLTLPLAPKVVAEARAWLVAAKFP